VGEEGGPPPKFWEIFMLKARAEMGGRTVIMIGLSFGNLRKFMAEPGDTFIKIDGKEMNLPVDVLLFSGETEARLTELIQKGISSHTIVRVDPKLKS
jgi:hypothetical protein